MQKLAERNLGMNWEIAVIYQSIAQSVFDDAMEKLSPIGVKAIKAELEVRPENDGGPYGSLNNADHYYLVVSALGDIPDGLEQGCQEMIEAITI